MSAKNRTRIRRQPTRGSAPASVEAILGAATELLTSGGYARLTTNSIAKRAGVNVSLVYHYFASKDAILAVLLDRAMSATLEAAREAARRSATFPRTERLRALLLALVHTPGLPPALHRELVERVAHGEQLARLESLRAQLSEVFIDVLAEGTAASPSRAATFVIGPAVEAATHAIAFQRPPGLAESDCVEVLVQMVETSIAAPQRLGDAE